MVWATVGLAIGSALFGGKSAKKKKKAARLQQEAVRLQNVRARSQAIKEYRIARAQVLSGAVASGADIRSSGYQGIRGSLQSQIQENARFSLEQEALGGQINKVNEQAAKYGFIAGALQVGAGIVNDAAALRKTNQAQAPSAPVPATSNPNLNPSPFVFNSPK